MKTIKIKAFTLMEITVALLISALVTGITYTAYTIIIQSYATYHSRHEQLAALVQLDELLKKDFSRSEQVTGGDSSVLFTGDSLRIRYTFNPGYIIRSAGRIDTFKFVNEGLTASFEGIAASGAVSDTATNRVDELQFVIDLNDEKIPYHYHKSYSSVNLFEQH